MNWRPQPKQDIALQQTAFEVLYGGARGGGKTDAGLVWLTIYKDNPRFRALVIRKNADDLNDWVDRAARMYHVSGATIAYRPAEIRFPSGAIVRTGHLKDAQAYTKYMGQEYPFILIEELTQIPDEKRYLQLIASCRSTVPGIKSQVFATTNPGGLGHLWVKARFVDPAPPMTEFEVLGRTRVYIPATVDDNPTLQEADPDYVKTLDALKETDVELWKAWRMGDWNTFAGQYFKTFDRRLHVIERYIPEKGGFFIGSLDWGRVDNFAFYVHHVRPVYFNGQMFYRITTFIEVYGVEKEPREWAETIKNRLEGYELKLTSLSNIMADNQIFQISATDVGKTIADLFYQYDPEYQGILKAASKNRVSGWEIMQNWLSMAPDGKPYWQITEACINLVRTLPAAVHDENKVEDINESGEDDALDSVRYGFMELKWIGAKSETVERTDTEEEPTSITEERDLFDDDEGDIIKTL